MCGIIGVSGEPLQDVDALIGCLHHRGPEFQQVNNYNNDNLMLGHVRLAIIDLDDRSNQPMDSACGRYTIVFNGEIYNYRSIRSLLTEKGYAFSTQSDTEVLLYWLVEHGEKGIKDLDGMFAFCLYDKVLNRLLLARDPFGEKPLYYASRNSNFAFCSEIAPLSKLSWVDLRLNMEALKNYLKFLYTAPPDTFYEGIKELPPGEVITYCLTKNSYTIEPYFCLVNELNETPDTNSAAIDADIFRFEFGKALTSRMVADVPIAIYLSGGLDSNAIAAQATAVLGQPLSSFTMSYAGDRDAAEFDESQVAKRSAEFYKMDNTLITLDGGLDFISLVDRSVKIFGQPFGNPTSIVADTMASTVSKSYKVCLVGDGGDELLGGYPRYRALKLHGFTRYFPRWVYKVVLLLLRRLPENNRFSTTVRRVRQFIEGCLLPLPEAYLGWLGYNEFDVINKELGTIGNTKFYDCLINIFNRFSSDSVRAAAIVDFSSFVPYNLMQASDRTSMSHSLEQRSPFIAKDLVMAMLRISSKNKLSRKYNKPILVDSLRSILPEFIINSPKRPFNPPVRSLIGDNFEALQSYLCDKSESKILDILSIEFVTNELLDFQLGRRDNSIYLWGLATLECWLRKNHPNGVEFA